MRSQIPERLGEFCSRWSRKPRLLTPVIGPLRDSFSGSAWYCAQAAISQSVIDGAFALTTAMDFRSNALLNPAIWRTDHSLLVKASLFKLSQRLLGQKPNGFKFHPDFSDTLWSRHLADLRGVTIVSTFQMLGTFFLEHYSRLDIVPCFYIDGTLAEFFYGYGAVQGPGLDPKRMQQAIEIEKAGYRHARCIMTMSQRTKENLVDLYGVDPDRVSVVLPGANIDDDAVPSPSAHTGWWGQEFTLGFVGLQPIRKGLDKLAGAVRILRRQGMPVRLRIIGECPDEIAAMDGVEFLGRISKKKDTARFVQAIRSVDLGCQLSRAELLGIAVLEFMRMGVPVLATALGGMPDVLHGSDDGGVLVPADISTEKLADELAGLISDAARYQELRDAAVHRSAWASWKRAVHDMDAALAGVA